MVHRHNLAHEDHDMMAPGGGQVLRQREYTGRRGFAVYAATTPSVADGLILQ
jgi:hypothetical protein